jgi:hypothetical protein
VNHGNLCVVVMLGGLALSGCTSDTLQQGSYEALYQKACLDRAGVPDCDPDHKSFETYRREREEVLERQPQ